LSFFVEEGQELNKVSFFYRFYLLLSVFERRRGEKKEEGQELNEGRDVRKRQISFFLTVSKEEGRRKKDKS